VGASRQLAFAEVVDVLGSVRIDEKHRWIDLRRSRRPLLSAPTALKAEVVADAFARIGNNFTEPWS
jgi:hypothetical protein